MISPPSRWQFSWDLFYHVPKPESTVTERVAKDDMLRGAGYSS